jgi:hypothetical protein
MVLEDVVACKLQHIPLLMALLSSLSQNPLWVLSEPHNGVHVQMPRVRLVLMVMMLLLVVQDCLMRFCSNLRDCPACDKQVAFERVERGRRI